ncbi:hypothetical protein B0T18DRAFT_428909 [Schizothecium vesticola]|uniref:FAD-binding PCMH-type domain-containing protein n=1 Tax=Schizothecium vesticola TaxID=314040 RepID=A0AA40EUW6_9PEZI|nr:hypothetical protein B0T18DRAFT_428909 [Schizothecium vesticola]
MAEARSLLIEALSPTNIRFLGPVKAPSIKIADAWKPALGSTYNGPYITVGIAGGLVQGGCHGPLNNQQGFLADTALEFNAITADGKLVTANADTNADLFWALRGGGLAAFAVIVEATYKTFVDPPSSAINLDITLANTGGSVDLL